MNVIVVGGGKVGQTMCAQLIQENVNVTLIDSNEKVVKSAVESLDVMGISGNGAVVDVLKEAGIENADILIAATNSDEINMLSCLISKKFGSCATIARIRNPEYYQEVQYLRDELNLAMAFNPERAAAKEVTRLLRFPSAMRIDTFFKGRMELMRVKLPEGSPLAGKCVYEIPDILKTNVLISIIERGSEVIIPSGNTCLQAGDMISFMLYDRDNDRFFVNAGIPYKPVRNCIFVGGGRLTYYIVKMLLDQKAKIRIKIIENNQERCEYLADQFPSVTVINGDGTDSELLKREGIENADAFLAMTGFDEENVILSMYAGKKSNARLITKVSSISLDEVIEEMPVGSIINPRVLVSDIIVQYVRAMENSQGSNVETLYKLADGKAEALEFRVSDKSSYLDIPFRDLSFRNNVIIGGIVRNGEILRAQGSSVLKANDHVIVITANKGYHDLKDIFQ